MRCRLCVFSVNGVRFIRRVRIREASYHCVAAIPHEQCCSMVVELLLLPSEGAQQFPSTDIAAVKVTLQHIQTDLDTCSQDT